jgi:hypothetical protein
MIQVFQVKCIKVVGTLMVWLCLVKAPPSFLQLWLPSATLPSATHPPAPPTNEGNARTIEVLALEPATQSLT